MYISTECHQILLFCLLFMFAIHHAVNLLVIMSSTTSIDYSGTVTVPTEDQSACSPAAPTTVSLLKIVESNAPQRLTASDGRKVTVTDLRVETSLLVPHTVFVVSKKNAQPAMKTPYNSLSRQIEGSDSKIVGKIHSKSESSNLSKVDMRVEGAFMLQPGLTLSDTVVSDVIVVIAYDICCAQIASVCHQEPVCGAFTISFTLSDGSSVSSAGKISSAALKHAVSASSVMAKAAPKKGSAKSAGEFDDAVASAHKAASHLSDSASSALKGLSRRASKVSAGVLKRVQELRQKAQAAVKSSGAIAKKKKMQAKSNYVFPTI